MRELATSERIEAPHDFIPPLPGWQERSLFPRQEGPLALFHYDFHAQVLSKLERGHTKDLEDARRFLERGLVAPSRLLELFQAIAVSMAMAKSYHLAPQLGDCRLLRYRLAASYASIRQAVSCHP